MADVARKALTDLEERTGTAYDDLMHVNSDGSDYKETKRNFLKGDLYYTFDVTTPITTQLENLPNGTYIGSIDSYGHQAETGVPANNSYYVYARKTGGSNMFISLVGVNQSGYEYYKIKSTQGWASDWTQVPTRAEITSLQNNIRECASISGSGSKTLTFSGGARALVALTGTSVERTALWSVFVGSSGSSIYAIPMGSVGSALSISTSAPSLTITSTAGSSYIQPICVLMFEGTVTVS